MNYFSVTRPPAGQIDQPQSCASFPGDHWKRSTLDRRSLSAIRMWPTQTPDDSDLSESDLDDVEDEYRLDISEPDSSEFEFSSDHGFILFDKI
ncbi:hypothetical protein AVEN_258366-1 [Araneus ventricosus]|uniref:Uncharacterized protein n=1 Tax=Araneus ventricosus TaxID=182803 RepID=A0A4Y2QES9_ARAVE|nr:hypothetical protein AVEN_258366-1 [Araneus ventricosus]